MNSSIYMTIDDKLFFEPIVFKDQDGYNIDRYLVMN
jgi:hypothetical protein